MKKFAPGEISISFVGSRAYTKSQRRVHRMPRQKTAIARNRGVKREVRARREKVQRAERKRNKDCSEGENLDYK